MCAMDIIYCWSHDSPLDIDRDDLTAYKCRSSSGVSIGLRVGLPPWFMASDRGQNPYSDFVALLRFENCSSSHCLLSSWRRFHVFESSRPSFHRTVFFGAPLAFLRGVAMGLCRRCVSVASFLCLRVVGSSFRRLHYILDSGIKVNFTRLCTSSAYKVQFDWFLLLLGDIT